MSNANFYESGEYWTGNKSSHDQDAEYKFSNAVRILSKNGIKPETILDVGCGGGKGTALLAQEYKVPTLGIDISPQSIADAKNEFRQPNLEFRVTELQDIDQHVDLGIMFDVFEHVDDYLGFLRTARPKANYWLFNIPLDMNVASLLTRGYLDLRKSVGHLHYFSTRSARATLEDSGYGIIDDQLPLAFMQRLKTGVTVRSALAVAPRLALSMFSAALVADVLGGVSMMALCKSTR